MPPLAAPSLVRNPERLPAHRRPGRIKASDQGDRRKVRPSGPRCCDRIAEIEKLADAAAPPHCDIPDTIV